MRLDLKINTAPIAMSACLKPCLRQTALSTYDHVLLWINEIDWKEQIRLITTATILGGAICLITNLLSRRYGDTFDVETWIHLPDWVKTFPNTPSAPRRTGPTCVPRPMPKHRDRTKRTVIQRLEIYLFAWPSRGGVIILDCAEAVDLEFLGLDTFNPPEKRLDDQAAEDAFCQRLLLLGAKWWCSERRAQFLKAAEEMDPAAIEALGEEREAAPTMRERRWVCVGWPSSEEGFWVSEFDTTLWEVEEEDNVVPDDTARLRLARTMDERCEMLEKHFKGRFYRDVGEYEGFAFLNSWAEKEAGTWVD
ncbi:hypothetical protein K402DRAFT_406976 [Aulographum hederae CBS 113979]|uniref:Uncharacterized protein n=1 Tax=Aulographum hederae CBS 113979 TaxID=1176131 RepID=A0A6G1GRB8_9PEZI|nr:hypothetical protein K402DRAFT_406976 [Aulographum hederae CBS 113979]